MVYVKQDLIVSSAGVSVSFCAGGQWVLQPGIFSFSYERK